MANNSSAFGNAKNISGKAGSFKASLLPLEILKNIKPRNAYPIAVSGTSNRVFTLNASVTNPVPLVLGNDYVVLRSSLSYTWTTGVNNILDSTGAASTVSGAAVTTAPWYHYVGMDSSGTISILPSLTAPSYVETDYESGFYTHPGTAKTQPWVYVGVSICDAATPTFVAIEKTGFWYEFPVVTVATSTTWALLDFSASIPKHGVEVGGYLETSATSGDTTEVGTSSTDGTGAVVAKTSAAAAAYAPFSGVIANSAGKIYGSSTTAAGDVHITRFKDVV